MTWRRRRPGFWSRVWRGRHRGLAVLLGLATILGFAFSLAPPESRGAGTLIAVGLGVVGLSVVSAWFFGRATLIPITLIEEMEEAESYVAQYCTPEHLQEACEMTRPYYGHEYVEGNVAEQWRAKNPQGFVEILNNNGKLCACFGLLGLAESFRDQFYAGNATDTRLRAQDILGPDETRKCRELYISGIVVRDPMTLSSGKRTRAMLWALLCYYKDHFQFRVDRTLYGIAANDASEKLLKTFGFNLRCPASARRDKCNLYDVTMNKTVWKAMMHRIWDLSAICETRW